MVTLKTLLELDFLTYDEFTYFIPLINDRESAEEIIESIRLYREEKITLEDVIYERLIVMENYQEALSEFIDHAVDEELICLIGMNRKSRNYDKPYYRLYENIKKIFLDNGDDYEALLNSAKSINQKPGTLWRSLLFRTTNISVIRKNGKSSISSACPFLNCSSERELKEVFFKYLHVFKAMATLSDYFDLNRRYFNITDTLIFEDQLIKLDMLPKYFFKEIMEDLYTEAFTRCDTLTQSIPLIEISSAFDVDINKVIMVS